MTSWASFTIVLGCVTAASCGMRDGDASDAGHPEDRDARAGLDAAPAPRDSGRQRFDAQPILVPDGWPWLEREIPCADSPYPGFEDVDGTHWRPCGCFEGTPLRPVPLLNHGGPFSVPFDCDWPDGTLWFNASPSRDPVMISASMCHYAEATALRSGLYPAPYAAPYLPSDTVPRAIAERLCVPASCVFSEPGAPPRCDETCQPHDPGTPYWTIYRTDRTACAR